MGIVRYIVLYRNYGGCASINKNTHYGGCGGIASLECSISTLGTSALVDASELVQQSITPGRERYGASKDNHVWVRIPPATPRLKCRMACKSKLWE